jgi:hypothetical protein
MSRITVDHDSTDHLYRFLDTDGDHTGTYDAIGNYSAGSIEEFYIQPASGEAYVINRMSVHVRDAGNFSSSFYGVTAALSTGIRVLITTSADVTICDLTELDRIKDANDWMAYATGFDYRDLGAGDNSFNAVWDFSASGVPFVLNDQEKFKVILNDDFTGLRRHTFAVMGFKTRLLDGQTVR